MGWDGEGYRFDLGQAGREIFLQSGLDSQSGKSAPPLLELRTRSVNGGLRYSALRLDLPVLTHTDIDFQAQASYTEVTLGVQSDRREPERWSEKVC